MNLFDHTRVILERDPAATSRLMVLTCYPGLQAVWVPPRRPGRTS
jgi:serine O-acetyltransferase